MVQASVPRPLPGLPSRAAAPAPARRFADRLPRGEAARRALWRGAWAPWWLGSDVPAPLPPAREPVPAATLGPAGEVVVLGLDQIARRLWLRHALHLVVRALWLGLAVGCLWLVAELAGGPSLRPVALAWVGGVLLGLGVIFALLSKPGRRRTARMLDRTFGLQERLTTAVDHLGRGVPGEGERATVVYLQMADAANAVAELRRHRALGLRIPVRELVLAIFFGLLLAALYFIRGVGGDMPPLAAAAVPAFTPAVERPAEPPPPPPAEAQPAELAPTVEEVRQRAERSLAAQRDLQALARALNDHAVTRSAAEAIGQGEYEQGANELRDLAPSADQLSPAAREELARDLEQAASQMSPGSQAQPDAPSQDLGSAARQAAEGLRQGEQAAQEGVRQLGDQVERTGGQVASQEELAEQMRRAQEAEAQGQRRGASGSQGSQQGQQGQAGQASEATAGEPGQPGQGGESGAQAPNEGQPGEGNDGEGGQPSGEPGEGGQQAGAQGEPGQEGAPGGQPGGQEGQPGQGQPGSEPGASGQSGEGGDESAGDSSRSGAGAGAGGGQGDEEGPDAPGQAPGGAESGEQGSQGAPAEQQVGQGSGEGVAGDAPAPVVETIQLPSAPRGEGVQTAADGGSSSRGSGAGVTAGAGSTVQGEVGASGPDSNRVPPDYREVVEDYFSQPEGEGGA